MKTITKKTAKNGATLYYIDGKRASRADAMYWQRQNEIERKYLARIEAEKTFSDAMSEVNTSADAIDAAVEAEIELINNSAEAAEETAEINAADVKVNVADNGKVIEQIKVDVDTAISIINRLNYRNDTFVYRHTTRYDNADIQCRHFDAYKADGEKDAFAITEYVINGKLEIVRFFNHFRNIIVDLQIGNVNYTLGDKGAIVLTDAEEIADITDAETAEVIPVERFWCEVEIAELSEQDAADIVAHFHGQDGANKFFKMRATELDGSEEDIDGDNIFDYLPALDELNDVDIDDKEQTQADNNNDKQTAELAKLKKELAGAYAFRKKLEDALAESQVAWENIHEDVEVDAAEIEEDKIYEESMLEEIANVTKTIERINKEIDAINNAAEENADAKPTLTRSQLQKMIDGVIAEREEYFDALEEYEADDECPQMHIDYLHDMIEKLSNQYWELVKLYDNAPDDEPPANQPDEDDITQKAFDAEEIADNTPAKFEVGKAYYARSACDYDCIFTFKVIARTAKTVTLEDNRGTTKKRKIIADNSGNESCMPQGNYSMAPCLYATADYATITDEIPVATSEDVINEDEAKAKLDALIDRINNTDPREYTYPVTINTPTFKTTTDKNGKKLYYIDGKRVGKDDYIYQAGRRQELIDELPHGLVWLNYYEPIFEDATTLESVSGLEGDEHINAKVAERYVKIEGATAQSVEETACDLTAKLKEVTRKARLIEIYPQVGGRIVDNLHKVEIVPDGGGFIFTNVYETLARYDTKEQCEFVIDWVKKTVADVGNEFEFPTAELVALEMHAYELLLRYLKANYRYIGKHYWQMRIGDKWRNAPRRFMAADLKYYGLTPAQLKEAYHAAD